MDTIESNWSHILLYVLIDGSGYEVAKRVADCKSSFVVLRRFSSVENCIYSKWKNLTVLSGHGFVWTWPRKPCS